MAELKLTAENRTEFGKGAARRTRRANRIPAVLYGHGGDPVHLSLPSHETALALRTANALLSIVVDGGPAQLALPHQVQRNPVKGTIEHVDLVAVRQGERVTVDVAIHVVGELASELSLNQDVTSIPLEVEATHIPGNIEVSVEGLTAGAQVLARDLQLPAGAVLHDDLDTLILGVRVAEELQTGDEDADAGAVSEGAGEGE